MAELVFAAQRRLPPSLFHEGDEPHYHEWSQEARHALAQTIWQAENVELTTVGIDVGSSTSHLMFSRVHLQRKTQLLSSQFAVVSREVLWRSPIVFTPFRDDFTIDTAQLRDFFAQAYAAAGLAPEAVDSGAVILTGEAIKRRNARAIADLFAAQAGKFVCASAGHHLECALAAHGGGAVAISRHTHRPVLNVDIGGGTTKLAWIRDGEIAATSALAVGGRLVAWDAAGRLTRVEEPALQAARALGLTLRPGERPGEGELDRLADALAAVVVSAILQEPPSGLARELELTAPLPPGVEPHLVTFTGGVSEYIFGRESARFGDIAAPLAERISRAFSSGRVSARLFDPGQGIRATVIGASQFTVQLSGSTIHLSDGVALPVRNVPVVFPALELGHGPVRAASVAAAIAAALERIDADAARPIALGIRWHGDPHYERLRELAGGIARALQAGEAEAKGGLPLIVMADGDIGRSLGHILENELGVRRGIVCIDGVQLREFDYVDIGERMHAAGVVPVIIKSLLFSPH